MHSPITIIISVILICDSYLSSISLTSAWSSSFRINDAILPSQYQQQNQQRLSTTSLFAKRYAKPQKVEPKPTMNREIRLESIRVVVDTGTGGKDETLGIMSPADGMLKAKELGGLDLIMINPNGDPPVCKIVDYSKWRYAREKSAKEKKKNSKASEVKEVKMSYKIDSHDYDVRVKAATRFINQGNRVKLTVMFKGREVQHDKLGFDLLNKVSTDMEKCCVMDTKPKRTGMQLICFVSPRPEVLKAINEKKRAAEKKARKEKEETAPVKEPLNVQAAVATAGAVAEVQQQEVQKDEKVEVDVVDMLKEDDDDDDDESALDGLLEGDALMNDLFG